MPTRTTTFTTADNVSANDLNSLAGAWNSYTPTLTQSATVAKTVTYAKYLQFGKLIICNVVLTVTGTGTTANAVTVGLPVTAAGSGQLIGTGGILDSGTSHYEGYAFTPSTTTVTFYAHGLGGAIGVDPAFALANTDVVRMSVIYEAA